MENDRPDYRCPFCGTVQPADNRYCMQCGMPNGEMVDARRERSMEVNKNFFLLVAYLVSAVLLLLLNSMLGVGYWALIGLTLLLALLDFLFAVIQPRTWSDFRFRSLAFSRGVGAFLLGGLTGSVVSYAMDYLNREVFGESPGYLDFFEGTPYPMLVAILSLAVFPAFFEELSFRGFLYRNLKVMGGRRSAIFGSALLFALVHFSVLNMIWIFPFGLLLAVMRDRSKSLIYGMLCHFAHNATVILLERFGGAEFVFMEVERWLLALATV